MGGNHFDARAARNYAEGPPKKVPGYHGLLRMTEMLIAETAPADARVLVLGAGGGLEIAAMAAAQPGWRFDGVDPSADMLAMAEVTAAAAIDRMTLHQGTIEDAPDGPFDAATCLLTFHFIARAQRMPTLVGLRQRLKPGARVALAHLSVPEAEPARSQWIARHVAFGADGTMDDATRTASIDAMRTRLTILAPDEEEAMLAEAGFAEVSLFYAGMSVRGWVATAA